MNSIYEMAQQIKKVTGWSQERIARETNLGLRTVNRVFCEPHHNSTEVTKRLIIQLHKRVVASPFSKEIDWLFERYDMAKETLNKQDFSHEQDALEWLLKNHKLLDSQELIACRLCWLLGHIYYDRAFYLRKNTIQSTLTAQQWYQRALDILKSHRQDNRLIVQEYKLQQCIVSTLFNSCEPGRRDNEKIRQWLSEMDYISTVKIVIEAEPWNWVVARNGLIASAILKKAEECFFFWETMQTVDIRFQDIHFTPTKKKGYWPSLARDPDLKWFIDLIHNK